MCTLRIAGDLLDVDALLQAVPLTAAAVHRRGEPRYASKPDGRRNETSGVNVGVSNADFSSLRGQISDALAFLTTHRKALESARRFPGVDTMFLDLPVEERDVMVQSDRFPAALLGQLGALGIDLVLSRYPPPPADNNA